MSRLAGLLCVAFLAAALPTTASSDPSVSQSDGACAVSGEHAWIVPWEVFNANVYVLARGTSGADLDSLFAPYGVSISSDPSDTIALVDIRKVYNGNAIAQTRHALTINSRSSHPNSDGYSYLQLGDAEASLALNTAAIDDYQHAISFFRSVEPIPDVSAEALALSRLGAVTEAEAEDGKASYADALAFVTRADALLGHALPQTLATRALIEEKLGNTAQAQSAYEAVVDAAGSAASPKSHDLADHVQKTDYDVAVANALAAAQLETAQGVPQQRVLAAVAGTSLTWSPLAGNDLLLQSAGNRPASFTLHFSEPVRAIRFVRAGLIAGQAGITHPEWMVIAYDAHGKIIERAHENLIASYAPVPARVFDLNGTAPISSLTFYGNNHGFAAFTNLAVQLIAWCH